MAWLNPAESQADMAYQTLYWRTLKSVVAYSIADVSETEEIFVGELFVGDEKHYY